eukprot:NODE_13166_length_248_cov_81.787565.p1 GENE.NODE_13166_length_248_cov_81.787565~~NODE_13166_length_248_cov_81.787565.p1  ORF type:complete len:62 (+),score=8.74 NODE_13166_length_248_cov_81.787565:57-242(+)
MACQTREPTAGSERNSGQRDQLMARVSQYSGKNLNSVHKPDRSEGSGALFFFFSLTPCTLR